MSAQVALITRAGGGIGRGITRRLSREGLDLCLVDLMQPVSAINIFRTSVLIKFRTTLSQARSKSFPAIRRIHGGAVTV